jgi:hypothetical protein
MKSSGMSWVTYIACMVEKRNAFIFLVGNLKERGPLAD